MVFDYVAGKLDWLANDLPIEGELAKTATAGSLADRNVLTCFASDSVGQVRSRLESEHRDLCVVVDGAGIVLGLLRNEHAGHGDGTVERLMKPGPATFRPHTNVNQLADYVEEKKLDTVLVTTSDGRLLGALRAEELRRKSRSEKQR